MRAPSERKWRNKARCATWALILVVFFSLIGGCARSTANLERYLRAGDLDRAVQEVMGKEKMASGLAVLILEKHLLEEGAKGEAIDLVDVLSRAGKPGKRALDRLAEKRYAPLSLLAQIALHRQKAPEIDEVMLVVNEGDSDVRYACIRAWYREMSLMLLKRALLDHDPRVRLFAVKGIAAVGMEYDVSGLLREALRLDPSTKVRAEAALQGKRLGEEALPALRRALEDPHMGVRLAAIQGLAETEGAAALEFIEEIAVGPLDHAAVVAAAELARLARPIGRERLDAALRDKRPSIRINALMHLDRARLADRRAILLSHLKDEAPDVVLLSARLLLRDTEARREVTAALKPFLKKEQTGRNEARDMLAILGDDAALKEAREILAGDDVAHLIAIIRRLSDASGLYRQFVALMASPEKEVRIEAAKAVIFSRSKI